MVNIRAICSLLFFETLSLPVSWRTHSCAPSRDASRRGSGPSNKDRRVVPSPIAGFTLVEEPILAATGWCLAGFRPARAAHERPPALLACPPRRLRPQWPPQRRWRGLQPRLPRPRLLLRLRPRPLPLPPPAVHPLSGA